MPHDFFRDSIKRVMSLLLVSLSFTLILSCEKEEEPVTCNPPDQAGELVDATFKITLDPAQIEPFLSLYGAPLGYTLPYSVDAYSIKYKTRDKMGDLTIASGIIFIPQGIETYDVVSLQHGTALKRGNAGSLSPLYAIDAALFGMRGFLAVSPDYIGLGVSEEIHPYLHAELTADAVIDMLRATRNYACENNLELSDKLFLAGYSEGGYATMATQKIMENDYTDEFQLTAVAPMSGPYDLIGSTRNLLSRETYDIPAYMAYIVVAYNDIYGWNRLSDVFREPYATNLPDYFDGSQALSDVNALLPTTIDSLFRADFVEAFLGGQESEIEEAIQENTLLSWGPVAPVRLYHGTADSTVTIRNTFDAYASLQANGGTSVELVTLLGADHFTGFMPSMILAEAWFDSIRTANQ